MDQCVELFADPYWPYGKECLREAYMIPRAPDRLRYS
jgi:hypothetical protein